MEKEPFVVKIHDVHIEEEYVEWVNVLKVGSINSIFYFLHKAAEPFNCLEQGNLA